MLTPEQMSHARPSEQPGEVDAGQPKKFRKFERCLGTIAMSAQVKVREVLRQKSIGRERHTCQVVL